MQNSLTKIAAIFVCIQTVQAEPPQKTTHTKPITLPQIVQRVLTHNPDILAAQAQWQAALEQIPQAKAWDDPRVGFTQRIERTPYKAPNSMRDEELTLEQAVPISGKNRSRARMKTAGAAGAFAEFQRTKWDAVTKAKIAWSRLANLSVLLGLNRENGEALEQTAKTLQTQYANGKQTLSDALVAETAQTKNEEDRADLELSEIEHQANLAVLADLSEKSTVAVTAPLKFRALKISFQRAETLAQIHRPELKAARAAVDAARARLQLAHREWIPDPSLQIKATRYNNTGDGISEVSGGIAFSVPWVNARKYSAEVREAKARLRSAQHLFDAQNAITAALLRTQFQKIKTTAHHYRLWQASIIPKTEQAVKSERAAYAADKATLAAVFAARRRLYDAQAMAQQQLLDHEIAVAQLESILGCELANSNPPSQKQLSHHHEK